jgi:hypothetical protein
VVAALVVGVSVVSAVVASQLGNDGNTEVSAAASKASTTTSTTSTTTTTTTTIPTFAINGSMEIDAAQARSIVYDYQTDIFTNLDNPECASDEGYEDVTVGTSITVYDGNSAVIGTGRIDSVEWTQLEESRLDGMPAADVPGGTGLYGQCLYKFSLVDLPPSDFYAIEVGRRGKLTYSVADLETQGWTVTLVLA